MPFTFSHPAIVLPFLKNKKLSASALIAGALSPDLEYFFKMRIHSHGGHTLLGVFKLDLPLGLLALFLFHLYIKKPLIENLPVFFKSRLQESIRFDWIVYFKKNYLKVIFSFVIAAFTHLILDSITHSDGYFVMNFDSYNSTFLGIPYFIYFHRILSFLGLIWITIYFYKLPVLKIKSDEINRKYWFWNFGITAVIFSLRFFFTIEPGDVVRVLLISMASSVYISFVLTGLLFRKEIS